MEGALCQNVYTKHDGTTNENLLAAYDAETLHQVTASAAAAMSSLRCTGWALEAPSHTAPLPTPTSTHRTYLPTSFERMLAFRNGARCDCWNGQAQAVRPTRSDCHLRRHADGKQLSNTDGSETLVQPNQMPPARGGLLAQLHFFSAVLDLCQESGA